MGNHAKELEIDGLAAIDERMEGAIESAVIGDEFPVFHIARLAFFVAGDDKFHPADLVGFAVVEDHIFACGGRIAKTVAQVPAESRAVFEIGLQTAPIPRVVISPNAASPVERGKRVFCIEGADFVAEREAALGAHAVDFWLK